MKFRIKCVGEDYYAQCKWRWYSPWRRINKGLKLSNGRDDLDKHPYTNVSATTQHINKFKESLEKENIVYIKVCE